MDATKEIARLCEIVARLRAPDGCPWDREQTTGSLVPPLLEEAYEVAGAVSAADDTNLREELGDLLLLIVMHAQIAAEDGRFDLRGVANEVAEKLIRRHPHVFAQSQVRDTAGVVRQWEAIKRTEKTRDTHYLSSVPSALPALMRAQKVQKKVARVHFDWNEMREVTAKVDEELGEVKSALTSQDRTAMADEVGDLFFAIVNLARKGQFDAESLLQAATNKFVARFNQLEDRLRARGGQLGEATLPQLNAIWNEIKAER